VNGCFTSTQVSPATIFIIDKATAPNQIKYAVKKKFEEKVLVWIAISE
jgi:hypothetical protein